MNNVIMPLKIDRAVIEINGGCNYKCNMCPQTDGREKQFLKNISLKDFERVVAEAAQYGTSVINLEGSGEPTLNRKLPKYIEIVKKYGIKAYVFSNGYRMQGNFMRDCVDAGLDYYRFSIIGYNREQYKKWMAIDAFDKVRNNAVDMQDYILSNNKQCTVASYHLVNDPANKDYEIDQYRKNFVDIVQSKAEIWMMHNWSGVYQTVNFKRKGERKTCGRPFSPDLTVRAGGNDGHKLSIAPCCQTLGRDSEAVLGNLDDQTIEQVWNGEQYQWLRKMHLEERFDEIPFCKDCDFLYKDPNVLVWTNYDREINKMVGTNFSLEEYQ